MAAAATSPGVVKVGSRHAIEEVTVYREGARVRRVMSVEAGATEARFGGLPLGLDDASVRASVMVEGGKGDLAAVDVRVALESPDVDAELADAEDQPLKAARLANDRCKHEVSRLEQSLARLEALKVAPRPPPRENEPPLAIPLEGRQKLVALRSQESERLAVELADARAAARVAERKLVEEIERHKRATSARNAKRHELRKVILLRLEGKAAAPAKIAVEYLVPGARWSASYALVSKGGGAKLTMRALVAQRSGEDWKGVRLILSTAHADGWVELPELPKARIGRAQPQPRKRGYREPPEGADALYADYDRAMGPGWQGEVLEGGGGRGDDEDEDDDETTPTDIVSALVAESLPPAPSAPVAAYAFGGAPAPPPGMAPPAPPMPRAAPARSAGLAGVIGRMMPQSSSDGAALSAPPMQELAKSRRRSHAVDKREDSVELLEVSMSESDVESTLRWEGSAPREQSWEADAESLAYGRLRMRGPSEARRGELVAIATAQVYIDQPGLHLAAGVSVKAILRAALERSEVDVGRLPAGHALATSDDSYDYAYAADLPADIPSDGAFHGVVVASYDTKSSVRYVVVPREGQQVFRLLDLESPIDGALLAGPLDVYEGEADGEGELYRTTTAMPQTPPRGHVEIGLGTEPAIKVARTTSFQEETAGLLGGSLALGHRIGVELRNLLPRAVTVEVRERVPVVRKDDADVKVEVGQVDPAWERWDQDQTLRGGFVWKVALDPGQSRTLSARYTIKISSKLELAGGNRRES